MQNPVSIWLLVKTVRLKISGLPRVSIYGVNQARELEVQTEMVASASQIFQGANLSVYA